jgi:hypothetical protein
MSTLLYGSTQPFFPGNPASGFGSTRCTHFHGPQCSNPGGKGGQSSSSTQVKPGFNPSHFGASPPAPVLETDDELPDELVTDVLAPVDAPPAPPAPAIPPLLETDAPEEAPLEPGSLAGHAMRSKSTHA